MRESGVHISQKAPHQPKRQPPPPALSRSRSRWRGLGLSLLRVLAFAGALGTIAGLILFADWVRDQYEALSPKISPDPVSTAAQASPYLLFAIHNNSKLADFLHVKLGCNLHKQGFKSEGLAATLEGKAVDPGYDAIEQDATITRGGYVTFPCDPAMERVQPRIGSEVLHNVTAELYVSLRYSLHTTLLDWPWPLSYRSSTFRCVNPGSGVAVHGC
jgi:hypothetical protein